MAKKALANTRTPRWKKSYIRGKKKKKCLLMLLFPENVPPDPGPLAHNLNLVMILPFV